MSDDPTGAAIGDLLSGLATSMWAETRQSVEYQTLAQLTRTQALNHVWADARDITLAIARRITVIELLPLRRNALELLFGIRTEIGQFQDEYRHDMLGGSTDRAYQSYKRLLVAALQDPASPYIEIPEATSTLADLTPVYPHMEGSTMQLLRWLQMQPRSHSAFWQLACESGAADRSDHLQYRMWKEFGRTVFNGSADPLRPTLDELEEIGESIFGPQSSATAGGTAS
jgi:hypothetical protein